MSEESSEKKNENIKILDLQQEDEKKLSFSKTFSVEYVDPITGDRLTGMFDCKRPTIGDIGRYGVIKNRLNGEMIPTDNGVAWVNEMVAFCQICITDAPKWWDPPNMYDEALIEEVYNHVRSFQDSFRSKRVGQQRG